MALWKSLKRLQAQDQSVIKRRVTVGTQSIETFPQLRSVHRCSYQLRLFVEGDESVIAALMVLFQKLFQAALKLRPVPTHRGRNIDHEHNTQRPLTVHELGLDRLSLITHPEVFQFESWQLAFLMVCDGNINSYQ